MDGMTKEQEEDMARAEAEIQKERDEEYARDQKVWEEVKKIVTPAFFKLIEEEIQESEGGWDFKIVDEPEGVYQDSVDGIKVWVNQTENGGYSGDSFSGTVSVELPNKKYLQWDYAM